MIPGGWGRIGSGWLGMNWDEPGGQRGPKRLPKSPELPKSGNWKGKGKSISLGFGRDDKFWAGRQSSEVYAKLG
jgi:hypothetical protein